MSIVHFFAARRLPAWLLAAFLLAALSACTGASPGPEAATAAAPGSATAPAKATTTVFSCPMHPHIQQHGPGQCPICGMDLQKREVAAGVAVSAAVVQSLGIRTATPVLRDVRPRVRGGGGRAVRHRHRRVRQRQHCHHRLHQQQDRQGDAACGGPMAVDAADHLIVASMACGRWAELRAQIRPRGVPLQCSLIPKERHPRPALRSRPVSAK